MSGLQGFVEGPVSEAIGWALLHSLWQGALIALILVVLLRQLAGQTAGVRYVVSCCALALLVVLPVITAYGSLRSDAQVAVYEVHAASFDSPAVAVPISAFSGSSSIAVGLVDGWIARARDIASRNLQTIVAIWSLGVAFLSARLFAGWVRLRRLAGEDQRAPDHLMQTLNSLADRLEIWSPIRLVQSRVVEVPMVIGWLEPVILLPVTALTGLTPQQLETILAHELAHVRRHDYLMNLGQTLIETLLFYHPATWWISRQIRIERENCCDDLAVEVCGDPAVYARALARLEQSRSASVLGIAISGGSLLSRIRRLVPAPEAKCTSGWVAQLSAVAMAGALLIGTPLAIFALNDRAVETGPGTSLTVTAPAIPAAVAFTDPGERLEVRAVTLGIPSNVEELPVIYEIAELVEDPLVFAELEHLGELFHLEELANGSLKVALFEIEPPEQERRSQGRSKTAVSGGHRKLTVDELIALKQEGVTPDYIESLKRAGLEDLSARELNAMAIHGVSANYIRALSQAGLDDLDPDELLALRIHGVNPEMVRALRESLSSDLDVEEIVTAAIHGLSPAWIAKMTAAGLGGQDLDELVALRIHGVSPKLVEELRALGFPDFSIDMVKQMAIHGVNASYIREMRSAGYENLDSKGLVQFRIHGVSPSFIAGMSRLGYSNIAARDLVRMRIHGVTERWVEGLQQAGYAGLTVDDLVRLRIEGTEELSRSRSRRTETPPRSRSRN